MKKNEIQVGAHYVAKVSGRLTTIRVDAIRERAYMSGGQAQHCYDVTNLATGRKTTFRSAAKFRRVASAKDCEIANMTNSEFVQYLKTGDYIKEPVSPPMGAASGDM